MNKVMLIGNVGKDPNVRYLDTGLCVAEVTLATTEKGYTLQNGTQVPDKTEWHTLIFWRKQAETVERYVRKGDKLYAEGKLQYRNWTDKRGIDRRSVEVMVEEFEMLGSPRHEPSAEQTAAPAPQPTAPAAPPPVDGQYPF